MVIGIIVELNSSSFLFLLFNDIFLISISFFDFLDNLSVSALRNASLISETEFDNFVFNVSSFDISFFFTLLCGFGVNLKIGKPESESIFPVLNNGLLINDAFADSVFFVNFLLLLPGLGFHNDIE